MSPFPLRTDLDLICIDNFQGGYILAKHLIKLGCRRLWICSRAVSAPTVKSRLAGRVKQFSKPGLRMSHDFFQVGNPRRPKIRAVVAAGRMKDAIICGNDYTAAVFLRSLHNIGVNVPRGLRVVGFDDVHYATLSRCALCHAGLPAADNHASALSGNRNFGFQIHVNPVFPIPPIRQEPSC